MAPPPPDDGRDAAQERLVPLLRDARWVRRLAARLAGDEHLADDLSQEALAAAVARLRPDAAPHSPSSLRAWLHGTLRNLVRTERRGDARRARRERRAARPEQQPSTIELVERTELQQRVVAAVLELPEPYRSTLLLRYVEDRPVESIAVEHGVETSTVRVRTKRGLDLVREKFRADVGADWHRALLVCALPVGTSAAPPIAATTATTAASSPLSAAGTPLLFGVAMNAATKTLLTLGALVAIAWLGWSAAGPWLAATPDPTEQTVGVATTETATDEPPATVEIVTARERVEVATEPKVAEAANPPRFTGPGTILAGHVVDSAGEPVAGAALKLLSLSANSAAGLSLTGPRIAPAQTVATDADGAFELVGLPPSVECALHVSAPGYAPRLVGTPPDAAMRIVMHPTAILTGRVLDAVTRLPLAEVAVRTPRAILEQGRLVGAVESVTAADGTYRLEGLARGVPVQLEVLRPGCAPVLRDATLHADGNITELDILLADHTETDVFVALATGAAVPGVTIRTAGPRPRVLARSDDRGRFRMRFQEQPDALFALERGSRNPRRGYVDIVSAHRAGFCQTIQPLAALAAAAPDARIEVAPSARVEGRVVDPAGQPIADAVVVWADFGRRATINEGWLEPGPTSLEARTDADGRFVLPDAVADAASLRLEVRCAGHAPVQHGGFGPVAAGETATVEITIGGGASLRGRTFINGVATRAYVEVVDAHANAPAQPLIRSDLEGHFSFHGLAEGPYRLRICTADGTAVWSDPVGVDIGVTAPEPIELHLRAAFNTLAGVLVSEHGEPLAKQDLYVFAEGAEHNERGYRILAGTGQTRDDGTFSVELKPGADASAQTYRIDTMVGGLFISHEGLQPDTPGIRLVVPEVTRVVLRFESKRSGASITTGPTLAYRRGGEAKWQDMFMGRGAPIDESGVLGTLLPVGPIELRVTHDDTATTHSAQIATGCGEIVLRL